MILLSQNLSKLDLQYISSRIDFLKKVREGKNPKIATNEITKTLQPLAQAGHYESIEEYSTNLPATSKFNSDIFQQIRKLNLMQNKNPRVLMALASYYNWKAREVVALTKNAVEISSLPDFKTAEKFKNTAINFLSKPVTCQLDPLAQSYIYNQTQPENINPAFATKMSNFRSKLLALIPKQINEENKFKLLYAFVENLIRFAGFNEYKKHQHQITLLFNSAQKPQFQLKEVNTGVFISK